jgi:hypothetical protein
MRALRALLIVARSTSATSTRSGTRSQNRREKETMKRAMMGQKKKKGEMPPPRD